MTLKDMVQRSIHERTFGGQFCHICLHNILVNMFSTWPDLVGNDLLCVEKSFMRCFLWTGTWDCFCVAAKDVLGVECYVEHESCGFHIGERIWG